MTAAEAAAQAGAEAALGIDDALDDVLGVDMKDVGACYIGPELRRFPDGSWEGVFGERYNFIAYEMGTYSEAVYLPYAGIDDVAELDKLRFPSADWHDTSTIAEQCARWPDHAIVFGGAGIPDFMNGIARCRGVEQVLLDVGNRDPVYLKLIEKAPRVFPRLLRGGRCGPPAAASISWRWARITAASAAC